MTSDASEPLPLKGLNVLVTRPAEQGESLVRAIHANGGEAALFPLLEIRPLEGAEQLAEIRHSIQDLDHFHILVFISTNAARYGLEWIDSYWPQFPQQLEVVAVGPTTAAALSALPCPIHTSPTGMQSEDILQLPVLKQVEGKKIALFRGLGGRELLASTLRERGATVQYVETYQREPICRPDSDLLGVLHNEQINVIVITSGQILDSLCQLVDIKKEGADLIPVLVPSKRLREKALAEGFIRVFCSQGATDDAIVTGLAAIAL